MAKSRFNQADIIFRELLKEYRIAKNLTQRDVAERLGLPQSYVSKYETGERRLDFVETAIVCDALGIGLDAFVRAFTTNMGRKRRSGGD